MPIIVDCHSCCRKLRVPEDLFGRQVQCPTCGTVFTAEGSEREVSVEPLAVNEQRRTPRKARSVARDDDYEDEPPRTRRREWDEDEAYDRPRRRSRERPGKVQAVAVMILIGGILSTVWGGILAVSCYGLLWPGTYYGLFAGIFAIVEASRLLGEGGHLRAPPKTAAILLIITIVNLHVASCVLGIVSLVFLSDPEVQRYYRG